jgi:hypothetical protein
VRRLFLALGLALAANGQVEAATASASFAVSVTVLDQCLIRAAIRSASCTGGAVYALGIAREKVVPAGSDQLTVADEHAHTARDGPLLATTQPVAGLAVDADRSVTPPSGAIDAIRITYSF